MQEGRPTAGLDTVKLTGFSEGQNSPDREGDKDPQTWNL